MVSIENNHHLAERHLRLRHVVRRTRWRVQPSISHIADNADDLAHRGFFVFNRRDARMNTLPEWAFVRKILTRKRFCDDDDRRRSLSIILIEIAALQNRNAHRAEVTDAGGEEVAGRLVSVGDGWSIDLKGNTDSI